MTSIDDLHHDLKGVSDNVLGDLDTQERLRLFIQEAAENREERIEWLADTAPRRKYTATDLEYMDGTKKLFTVSLLAKNQLQQNFQAILEHEAERDRQMALMMLNEALSRLSGRDFEIGEFGAVEFPASWSNLYGQKDGPRSERLATKYRELWEEVPADLLLDEEERENMYFTNLAAIGLLAYRDDLSVEAFDDLEDDYVSSEVYLSELRLLNTLTDFYINFHGWRLFAEEYLDVTLDKLLEVAVPDGKDDVHSAHYTNDVTEQLCENILSLKSDYLEAYPPILEEWFDEEIDVDLDARAQEFAEGLAEDTDLPGVTTDA